MKYRLLGGRWLLATAAVVCALVAPPARAAEPFEPFLEGLRRMRLHDMAIEYLTQMRDSPLISTDQRQLIPYEEARTYVDAAKVERDLGIKNRLLDQARDKYAEFIRENSAHPLTATAEMEMGVVLVERGIALREAADRAGAERENMMKQAREYLAEADKVFNAAREKYEEELKTYPKFIAPNETARIEARDRCKSNVIQAQMYAAAGQYEMARTYKDGTPDKQRQLQATADAYGKIYENYRTMIAGLLARIKEAQCYQELGDMKRALGLYRNIVDQPAQDPTIRRLRAAAMYKSLECWNSGKERRYELARIQGEEFLIGTRPDEENQSDWLAIRYHLAQAYKKYAEEFTERADAGKRKNELDKARGHLEVVSRYPSAFQDLAKAELRDLRGIDESNEREPRNFVEARDRGQRAMDEIGNLQRQIADAAASNDTANVPKYQEEILNARARAARFFRLALDLRDESDDMDDVNMVRFFLCYFLFEAKDYYDAAVLGEFLARHYPNSAGGRQGAKIAMASYAQEFNRAKDDSERVFDRAKMLELAEFIVKRWPDEAETDEARSLLITIYGREGNIDRVLEVLAQIPEDSPRRADSELKVGQSLWSKYFELGKAQAEAGSDEQAAQTTQQERDRIANEARSLLETAVERAAKAISDPSEVDVTTAGGALSLLQIYVNMGEGEKAVALLEHEKLGPKTLIDAKAPVADRGKFKEETLKLALRAYVAVQDINKATGAMDLLEETVAASSGGAAELTKIYFALGRELQDQVALLRENNKQAELEQVSKGFELFLDRVAQQEKGNTFGILNWVAETFGGLGAGFAANEEQLPEKARGYLNKALETDKKILETSAADPTFAPSEEAQLAIRMRMARNQRMLGDYEGAVNNIATVLKARPQLLDAQTEGALALHGLAKSKKEAKYFALPIGGVGNYTDPKTNRQEKRIWGWSRLAAMTQSNDQFKDTYFNARLHLAECYLLHAEIATGSEKQQLLDRAEQTISITMKFKPDLGGDAWRAKYDQLMRSVQKAQNKRVDGLKALETAQQVTSASGS